MDCIYIMNQKTKATKKITSLAKRPRWNRMWVAVGVRLLFFADEVLFISKHN